jgi:large subunit ribosomal protein L10
MDSAEKNQEVSSIADALGRSLIALCADYRGLTVAQITALRRDLRSSGSHGKVVKNTLARLAVEKSLQSSGGSGVTKFLEVFRGPTMLVYSFDDAVAPAKVLAKYAKEIDKFSIKGAYFEGSFIDPSGVEDLSRMPSREEVLAQLLRVINAPATNLVRLLNEPGSQVARLLEAHRANLESAA